MKTDLEKRLEYVRSQREILQRTEEELQKQLETKKEPEFDFRKLMPVGSVWLGCKSLEVEYTTATGPYFKGNPEPCYKEIYHAHQIVKAAVHYIVREGDGWHDLNDAVLRAEAHGVLQNLK